MNTQKKKKCLMVVQKLFCSNLLVYGSVFAGLNSYELPIHYPELSNVFLFTC